MSAAPRTTSITIPGPAGALEAIVDEPIRDATRLALGEAAAEDTTETVVEAVGVVCHPHPLFGGNMHNKVAHILARACNELGAPAVRFNFRGVGHSAGTHDDGRGETDDVLAAIDWSTARWPQAAIWLSGFSFGAAMALRAALQRPVARLITVAPALRWLEQIREDVPACPWLIVQGDRDDLVDADAVTAWVRTLSHPPELKLLAGAEHFFHGRLNDVRETVSGWLAKPGR